MKPKAKSKFEYPCPDFVKELPLPAMQRKCLALLLLDLRDHEIAARLGVSPRTVKNHLAAVRQRLNASSRVGVVLALLGYCPKVPVSPPAVIGTQLAARPVAGR